MSQQQGEYRDPPITYVCPNCKRVTLWRTQITPYVLLCICHTRMIRQDTGTATDDTGTQYARLVHSEHGEASTNEPEPAPDKYSQAGLF